MNDNITKHRKVIFTEEFVKSTV